MREPELEHRDRAAGPDDARQLAQGRGGVVDVAQEVGERQRVEGAVVEREAVGAALDEPHLLRRRRELHAPARDLEHLRALVEPDDGAALLPHELERDGRSACRDVEDGARGRRVDA